MSHLIMKYEALDIETIWVKGIAKPICIAITEGKKINFRDIKKERVDDTTVLDFLLEKCKETVIYYVHNLTFEMFVFIEYLVKKKNTFKMISANKIIYSAEIKYGDKTIKLRCSYRLTMLSLKNLAKFSGVEEKGVFPYKILTEKVKESMLLKKRDFNSKLEYEVFTKIYGKEIDVFKIIKIYCENDALITKKSIILYWSIIIEGGLKNNSRVLTAAKLSVKNFFSEKTMIKKKIKLIFDRTLRPNYFGGRTEVYGNLEEGEIALHYDWTGMYAQCMKEKVLGGEIFESDLVKDIKEPGFYWIKFKQNMFLPILPIKRDKLLFPNGVFEGWYWFEEIILAMQNGIEILEINKIIGAQYYDNFIEKFIEKNEKIRKLGELHNIIGKNNNNTFYGRLGMDPERLEEEITSSNIINGYESIYEINGVFVKTKKKEKSISNITVAAAITAKARIRLYKGMQEVMKRGGRVLYTDTDSIIAAFKICEYTDKMDVAMGEVIFDSKKKDTIIQDAVFALPKTYALKYKTGEEVVKIKGYNVKPKFNEFKKKFYNGEVITTKNLEWGKKDFRISITMREKRTDIRALDKRKWDNTLKKTEPIDMSHI